jgi:hypothetical protein
MINLTIHVRCKLLLACASNLLSLLLFSPLDPLQTLNYKL